MAKTSGDRRDSDAKIRKYKQSLDALKKENARLRKELSKMIYRDLDCREIVEDDKERARESNPRTEIGDHTCQECGKGEMIPFSFPIPGQTDKIILTCNNADCGHRITKQES